MRGNSNNFIATIGIQKKNPMKRIRLTLDDL